jgi:hypothetical protein
MFVFKYAMRCLLAVHTAGRITRLLHWKSAVQKKKWDVVAERGKDIINKFGSKEVITSHQQR